MPFWSGDTIRDRVQRLRIVDPFDDNQIDCAAYTLRMGAEAFITPDGNKRRTRTRSKLILKERKDSRIPPGQFAFLLTKETIDIPTNVIAFISLKSTTNYKGLINVSGFHVAPVFRGHLIYTVYNAGPADILLEEGKDLFLIWFADLDAASDKYNRTRILAQTNIDLRSIEGSLAKSSLYKRYLAD